MMRVEIAVGTVLGTPSFHFSAMSVPNTAASISKAWSRKAALENLASGAASSLRTFTTRVRPSSPVIALNSLLDSVARAGVRLLPGLPLDDDILMTLDALPVGLG